MKARDLLHKLKGVKRSGDGWTARCPAHGDARNSLSISDGRDGKLLLFCHAGCSFEQIIVALGTAQQGRGIEAEYDYRDESGAVLYQAVRFSPKGFMQKRPDGNGGYEWKLNGTRRVLYRLPELLASEPGVTIFMVEGEKDCDNLAQLGLTATTNIGGAGKWRDEYSQYLRARHVVILPDNDEPGRKHAEQVAISLAGIAASTKVVELPGLPPKGDVSDWLDAGGTVEQLKALAEAVPERPPERKARSIGKTHFTFSTLDDLLGEPEEETAYLWDRTLPLGGFSIIAAKPKAGKSTFARNLAVAVQHGSEFFGRATSSGIVIYLCLEEKRAEVAHHFRKMGASGDRILIHTGAAPDDTLEALESAIEEYGPAFIIIDPLSRFVRVADFNSYGDVTRGLEPLIDMARTSGCHIMAVHHNGKAEREGGDSLLGSTGFFASVDTLLIVKRRERARTIETIQRYGEDLPETVVHLDPETGLVTPGGDMKALLLNERKEAALECFGDEPLAEADVKERISGNQGLTSKAVRALYEEGRLIRTGAGKKGDPYRYQRPKVQAETANENSGFSGFPIYTDPGNLGNPESGERTPDWNYPPGLAPDDFDARCAEVAKRLGISQREAACIVIEEHHAASIM